MSEWSSTASHARLPGRSEAFWDVRRQCGLSMAHLGRLKPGDSGDGKTCWNCMKLLGDLNWCPQLEHIWLFDNLTGKGTHNLGCPSRFGTSIWLWPVSHVALLAVTWPRPTRSSELPKGGGPWLGKSSTLGTKIDPIYIYISNVWYKNISNILEPSQGSVYWQVRSLEVYPLQIIQEASPYLSPWTSPWDRSQCPSGTPATCAGGRSWQTANACHGTTSTEFGAEKHQWLLRPATLLGLGWWKMHSFLVFSTWWCRRTSWNCFNDSIFRWTRRSRWLPMCVGWLSGASIP